MWKYGIIILYRVIGLPVRSCGTQSTLCENFCSFSDWPVHIYLMKESKHRTHFDFELTCNEALDDNDKND